MNNIQNYVNNNVNLNYGKINRNPNFKGKYFINTIYNKPRPKTLKNILLEGNFDDWMNFIFKKLGLKKP